MAASTKTYRDGAGSTFTAREWDDGTAFSAVTVLGDGLGGMVPKAEDAPAVSGDVGIPILGVRRDSPASSAGTDGDYATFNFDATGNLYTTTTGSLTIAAGATTIAKAEDVASANADVGVPAMAIQKATPADTAGTDGDYAMLQMSAGRLWTSSLLKDGTAGTLVKAEDDAAVSGDLGFMVLGVRRDSPASSSGTSGDYSTFNFDANGSLYTTATTTITGSVSVSSAQETSFISNAGVSCTPKFQKIVASSSGATTIVAAVGGKKIRVLAWDTIANAAVNFKWQSHVTPTDLTGLYYMSGQGNGVARSFSPVGYFETVSGEALDINLSTAVAVGGVLTYIEV